MPTENRRLCILAISAVFIFILGFSSTLWADPPARVARLSLIQGAVSFHPATVDDWAPAQVNYPLTTGDGIWIDANSRAELHTGSSSIQMGPQTNSSILNLDDRTAQIQLSQGTIDMSIRAIRPGEIYEVDTPNAAISPARPGWYRIDVDPQGNTIVTSRNGGETEVTAAGSAFEVYDNQAAHISGADSPTYDVQNAPPPDAFDQWCLSRYRREERPASLRYVSRDLIGYEDLDPYGYWQDVQGYGPCWIPSHIASDWAPYRYGRWCWEEPWGWTWIDDQPWGFATCHYGRWVHARNHGWAWAPGPLVARPFYAPALVAFVGGRNWSVGFASGGGPVGWFPLGPGEIYRPPYQVSNVYVRNVNYEIRNFRTADVGRANFRYVNREFPGAVTVVSQRAFVSSAPVYRSMVRLPQRELASATVIGATAPLVPRRESVLAHPSGLLDLKSRVMPPAAVQNRPVVVRHEPPPPRVPFSAQERILAQHPGRPPEPAALNGLRSQVRVPTPQVRMAVPQGPSPGMHPAHPGLPPARPVPGAQVRNTPPGASPMPGAPGPQKEKPGPQRAQAPPVFPRNERGRMSPQPAPARPPERLGRSQPFPSPAAPRPAPHPRQNMSPIQPRVRPNPPPQPAHQQSQPQPRPMQSRPQVARPEPARPAPQPRQSPPQTRPQPAPPAPRPQARQQMQARPQAAPHRAAPPPRNNGNPDKDKGRD